MVDGTDGWSFLNFVGSQLLNSRLWKWVVRFGTQQLVVASWDSADGKQRLRGTLGGGDVLSLLCLLCVSLCLGCHFLAPIPHDRVNSTVRMSPLATSPSSCACVCPARVCLFVPKHPASLLIEFSLSHLCVSTWLSSRYDWHCPSLPLEKSPNIRILHPSFILLFLFSYASERCFRSLRIVLIHVLLLPSWSMQKFSKCSRMAYLRLVSII